MYTDMYILAVVYIISLAVVLPIALNDTKDSGLSPIFLGLIPVFNTVMLLGVVFMYLDWRKFNNKNK